MTREERSKINYDKTHKTINGVLYKKCSRHHINYPNENEWFLCNTDNFYKWKQNKTDGLASGCKKCDTKEASIRQYKKYHSDTALKEYHREYFLEHQDYYRDVTRKYQSKKKDIIKKNQKIWWQSNKDIIKQYNYNRSHKNHRITNEEWKACKEYFNNSCAYCGLPAEKHYISYRVNIKQTDLHKEHVIYNGANDLSNCVPACRKCNSSKSNRQLENWYNENIPVYDAKKLDKIKQWINNDYKNFIEIKERLPYTIKRVRNENSSKYHFELWDNDENDIPSKCLEKADKKKDLYQYINKYYNKSIA